MAATLYLYFCFVNSFPVDMSASRITTGADITLYRRSQLPICESCKIFLSRGNMFYASIHGTLIHFLDTLLRGAIVLLL